MNRRSLAVIAFMAVCVLVAPTSALAGTSTYSGTGHDVSYPNCPAALATTLPSVGAFGIVGVTHGRAFTYNSCLDTEYNTWALPNASLYMNLNGPVGSTAKANISQPVTCIKNDKLCQSHNYGWNAAKDAYACASGASSTVIGCAASGTSYTNANTTWWLDVETTNSWLNNLAANAKVVQGAIDYLGTITFPGTTTHLTVGVYSTNSMWHTITGGSPAVVVVSPVPVWYATAVTSVATAQTYCPAAAGSTYAFTGGPVWLVQFVGGTGIDADVAC